MSQESDHTPITGADSRQCSSGDIDGTQVLETSAPSPSAPSWPDRNAGGRFVGGNLAAIKHALRTDALPPEFAHLREEVDAFVAGCLSDEGDASDVSTRRRALLEYRARLHRRVLQLDAAIEVRGLFDKKGKLRAVWLQRLEGLIDKCKALDNLLGLARRQKRVGSIEDYVNGAYRAPQQRASEE